MIKKGARTPRKIHKGGREVHWLTKGGRTIYMSPTAARLATKAWLDANVVVTPVTVMDSEAFWFEVEVTLPGDFSGNPVDGWTNGTISLGLYWSEDLATWVDGGWIAAPGKTTETLGDGRKKHFARYEPTPIWWEDVMVDLTIESDRYGKSITAISVLGTAVSLPNYPYDMPSEAAQLQTDLRSAGYTGTVVSSVSGSLVAQARNYLSDGARKLVVTMSGSNVTAVAEIGGSTISLPGYPYSMPSQRATLQSALRTAGKTGAVVKLFGDSWTIMIPDRTASGVMRPVDCTISPSDPYPAYDFYGNYQGEAPDNLVVGSSGNVRTPTGDPLTEAKRAFARVGFINIPVI